jgi:hypothetical protein
MAQGPDGMQAFLQAAGQMDSAEVEPQMDDLLSEVDPALAQQIQAELSTLQLPNEVVQVLLDMINALLQAPEQYAQLRMEAIEAGLPADFLPEEFNIEYLSTLRYVLMRVSTQETEVPVQGFKDGGAVSLKPIAKFLASQGRNGDTTLAHINKSEEAMLRRMGGSGTINPVTGLREYSWFSDAWKSVKKGLSKVASAVKKVTKPITDFTKKILANPIVRTIAVVAASVYLGPIAAKAVGAGVGTSLSAAVGTTIATTGVNLLAGQKPKDAIKQGLMAGTIAGVGTFAMGAPLTEGGYGLKEQYTLGNLADKINPFSESTPAVTADTRFDELVAKGLPRNAETYRLASESARASSNILGMSPQTASWAIPTAATLVPPILAYMGQEPPPAPEDLDMPGVGGPTGADLLASDPGTYGVNLGGTSSSYIDPYENLVAQNINVGAPGASPTMPNPAPGGIPPKPGFSPVLPTVPGVQPYTNFAAYDPTKDPLSPQYNPFGAPASGPTTGGFNVAQGFAEGGIATFAKGGKVSELAQRQRAAEQKRMSAGAPTTAYTQTSSPKLSQVQLFEQQKRLTAEAQKEAAARQRAAQRDAVARQARIDSAVNAAMQAAQEGRSFEPGAGYASERDAYFQAISAAQQRDPFSFMTPEQVDAYNARQQAIAAAEEQARLEAQRQQELAAQEKLAMAAAANVPAPVSAQPVPNEPSMGIGSLPNAPVAAMPSTPSAMPSTPVATSPVANPVYGPDGTQYPSPAAAITAGVFNYTTTPVSGIAAVAPPSFSMPSMANTASTFDYFNVPSAPINSPSTPLAFGVGGFGSGAGFAKGGIASVAPYKFSRGSNPSQNFPRRTGPISGPGTEKSDSIPAMLSDGEFVFTAKAVRGMGNGSRLKGAKKMYKMMKMLEGKG